MKQYWRASCQWTTKKVVPIIEQILAQRLKPLLENFESLRFGKIHFFQNSEKSDKNFIKNAIINMN